jgi:membrane-bound lytic murein transglycosylase D
MRLILVFITLVAFPPWILSGCAMPWPPFMGDYIPSWMRGEDPEKKPVVETSLPSSQPAPAQSAPAPAETRAKREATPAAAAAKRELVEKVKAVPERPTALQEAPGPTADDRLLGLWQQEVDKAMALPTGQRKIQLSMHLVENDRVRYFVSYFCKARGIYMAEALARSGRYVPMMAAILQQAGLPEELVYLSLIESGFSPYATSRSRAVGPWQFMRTTGIRYGLRIDSWVDERRDPVKSTRAAAAYLKDLHQQFGEWFLAAAAYNAGEGSVVNAIQRSQTNDFWRVSQATDLKEETRNYVPKFIAVALIASEPEKCGLNGISYEPPLAYDEVSIQRPLSLEIVARLAKVTVGEIKELNPALLRNTTPPTTENFRLRVPAGGRAAFEQAYKATFDSKQVKVVTYTVKKGETLAALAKRYQTKVDQIMEFNGLKTPQLRAGQQLIVVAGTAKK